MGLFLSNINKINEDIESFVIAKNKIEKYLIDNHEIKNKMTVQEFLNYIDFNTAIVYIDSSSKIQKTSCIKTYNLDKDMVILYTSEDDNIDNVLEDLKKINYDISKLKKYSQLEFLNNPIQKYFLIGSDIYII